MCVFVFAAIGKKPPPAPGCVDQQLTSLTLNTNSVHTELDIPPAPADTPYALQILLDMYRAQYLAMVEIMKSPHYRDNVNLQIERDKVSDGLLCLSEKGVPVCYWRIILKWCCGLLVLFRIGGELL
jgi:hypothetical protein